MTDVISPDTVSVYFDTETALGDGGTGGTPAFKWIGIIDDVALPYDNSMKECRGIGSIDLRALSAGMKNPSIDLKYYVQKKRSVSPAFDPATLLDYVVTPPTGIGLGYESTFGSSYMSVWFKGAMLESLEVDFDIDGHVKATTKFVAQSATTSAALISAASRAANPLDVANGYAIPLTGHDVEVFMNAAGAANSTMANVKRGRFSIKNNYVRIPVVRVSNSTLYKYILRSKRELSGEVVLFVESKAELDWLINATLLDIRFDLEKSGNTPYFDFTSATLDAGALSTKLNEIPCELTLPFKATAIAVG